MSQVTRERLEVMTDEQLNRLTKTDLVSAIRRIATERVDTNGSISDALKAFAADWEAKMTELLTPLTNAVTEVKKQNVELKAEVDELKKVVSAQQVVLQAHEKERRARNVVIRGVPERNAFGGFTEDSKKVSFILGKVNSSFSDRCVDACFRLGPEAADRNRPILVKFVSQKFAHAILRGSSVLKGCDGFDRVFVHADLSPAENRERIRMRKAFGDAKANPQYAGKRIELRRGKLLIDGQVVDSARNVPFLA